MYGPVWYQQVLNKNWFTEVTLWDVVFLNFM